MIRLEPRARPSAKMVWLAPLLALALTVICGWVLFTAMGANGFTALYAFFIKPITTLYGLGELTVKAAPLILIGIGLGLGFRANVWNIGAEGQFAMGALTGGCVGLYFYGVESPLILPAMLLAGAAGGAFWAAFPAFFRTRFGANEILTSLMLVYVGELILSYLVHGPLKDPDGYNFPESRIFHDAASLGTLVDGTRIHLGAVLALVAVVIAWFVLARSFAGYKIRVIGDAPKAGAYAGFSQNRIVWTTMLTSGAFAGLAGVAEVAGPIGQLLPDVSPGYGFTGIIVAFLGRLHPVGILFAGLLMALSYLGAETVQLEMGLPVALAGVFQGMLLFFVLSSDVLIRYRVVLGRRAVPA